MKSKNLFLGILLLFIGVISLLASLDVIDFSWRIAWKLWPMLFIFVGIAILPIKEWLRALLLLATLALGMLLYQHEASKDVILPASSSKMKPCLTVPETGFNKYLLSTLKIYFLVLYFFKKYLPFGFISKEFFVYFSMYSYPWYGHFSLYYFNSILSILFQNFFHFIFFTISIHYYNH